MTPGTEGSLVEAPLTGTGTPPVSQEERRKGRKSLFWRIVSPVFTLKQVNILCWTLFAAFLAVPTGVALKGRIASEHFLGQVPENDFIYFFGMGRIFNHYPAARLYDYELQKQVLMELHPLKTRPYGPNPYAPFVGILFRPFAAMPYFAAYLLWLSVSFALYIAGLTMITGTFFSDEPVRRSLIFCLALSFYPFFWLMTAGQISAIGFFALALAFREESRERPLLSGLALSLCLYKPTLLLLFLPMLLITRRYETLIGFASGGIALAIFATAIQGTGIWSGYIHLLLSFGSGAAQTHSFKQHWMYADLSSFSSLIFGGQSWLGRGIVLGFVCCVARSLWRACRNSAGAGKRAHALIWAATLTWTLVLNLYIPIYDCIFAVLAVVATAGVLKDFPEARLGRRFTLLCLLILASSWITTDLAKSMGLQILTASIALLGIFQLALLGKILKLPGGGDGAVDSDDGFTAAAPAGSH